MEFEVQHGGEAGHSLWVAAEPDNVLHDLVGAVVMCASQLGPKPALVKGMLRTTDGIMCFVKYDHEKEMGSTCWINVNRLSPI